MPRKSIIEKSIAKDLGDESTQAKILKPEGVEVTIGGKPLRLYPLSAYDVRTLTGFVQVVLAASQGPGEPSMRISGTLVRPQYVMDFLSLLASATFASPANFDAEQHAAVFAELNDATASPRGAIELANAYAALVEQNDVLGAFEPAKKAG